MLKLAPSLIATLLLSACAHPSSPPTAPIISNPIFSGDIWSTPQARAQILFQDGSQSIPCKSGGGGTLWAFGDTFLGTTSPPGSLTPPAKELHPNFNGAHSATIAWLPAGETSLPPKLQYFTGPDGNAACPLANFPDEPKDQFRMWPTGGVQLGPRTYLYYSMIQVTDAKPPWNFRPIGGGLAVADQPLSAYRRLTPNSNWRFPVEPIQVLPADQTLYLYEVRGEEPKGLLLARVTPSHIEDPNAYEFFTGLHNNKPNWSTHKSDAQIILKEAYGQVSIAWNQTLHAYLAVTSADFFHPSEIQFRTAPNPWGPFSTPTRLSVPEKPNKKTNLIYCSFLHLELSTSGADGSQLTLTFCRILEGDWECSNPETVTVHISRK